MNKILAEDYDNIINSAKSFLPTLTNSKILITGACGFIGAYLVEMFCYLNDNYGIKARIFAVDSNIASKFDRLSTLGSRSDLVVTECDIADKDGLWVITDVDYIINAASIASPEFYMRYPLQTMRVNSLGTWNVLARAVEVEPRSVLHFSSSEIYGEPSVIPTPESYWGFVSPNGPRSMYDESKRFSETLCMIYARDFQVPVKVIRPFNIFGPGQRIDDGRVIPNLIKAALCGETFTVYGDGLSTRSYCYISDAVIQMLAVLTLGTNGETYNIGDGGSEISLVDLVKVANDTLPGFPGYSVNADSQFIQDAPTRRKPDTTKITELVGSSPRVSLAEGLRRTFETYRT